MRTSRCATASSTCRSSRTARVVYATIFAAVVIVLHVAETIITQFAVSKVDSIAVELALALAVALSVKPVERRIDALVERFLFARKHATEQGLLALIRDCPHVEDPDEVLQNVCDETRRLIGARTVVAYERCGRALDPARGLAARTDAAPVGIDDPVVVRMRSSLAPVDLGVMQSSLGATGTVFPMLSRGRMLGALVCGDKPGRRATTPTSARCWPRSRTRRAHRCSSFAPPPVPQRRLLHRTVSPCYPDSSSGVQYSKAPSSAYCRTSSAACGSR